MNKGFNPPRNSSLAKPFIIENIEYNWRRGQDNIPFWWECSQWRARTGNWRRCSWEQCSPQLAICPQFGCGRQGGRGVREESVRRALEGVEASDSRTEEASERVSFVDVMGSLEKETGGESEGFTFADILQRADLLWETLLEGVVGTTYLPLC